MHSMGLFRKSTILQPEMGISEIIHNANLEKAPRLASAEDRGYETNNTWYKKEHSQPETFPKS
jgi:hypothetical protein